MKMIIPKKKVKARVPRRDLRRFAAHAPNAPALPVFESMETKEPSRAQKRNILMFQLSVRLAVMRSAICTAAGTIAPPLTIRSPENIPSINARITSLNSRATTMVSSGGKILHSPIFSTTAFIFHPLFFNSNFSQSSMVSTSF